MAVDNKRVLRALKKIPLWAGLNEDELDTVYRCCQPLKTDIDQIIFEEGSPSHHLYILLAGRVDIITAKKGLIHTVKENETFGEIGLITQNPRSASALSVKASSMLKLHHVEFNTMLGKQPRISALMMRNITTSLSQHIVRMNQSELEYLPSDELTKDLQDSTSLILNPDSSFKY